MNQVLASTTLFYGAQLVARLINFGYMLALARTLAPDAFGELNLALSILLIADTTADFGLSRLLLNETSRDLAKSGRYLSAFVTLKLATSTLAYVAALLFGWASGYPGAVIWLMAVAGLGLVFTGASMTLEMGLHVRQRFGFVALAHLALSVIQAATGFAALAAGGGAVAIAGTYVVTNAAYVLMILAGLRRAGAAPSFSVDPAFWRTSLGASAPFGAMAILALLATRIELLTLGWFGSGTELGAFAIALKLMDAALLAPVTLGTVMAPSFARYHDQSRETLTSLYLTALRYGLLAAAPGALLAAAVVPPLMHVVLGERYGDLTPLIRTVFAAFPFAAAHCLNVGLLLGSDRRVGTLALSAGLIVAQGAIALALVSARGLEGAAYAFLATSVISAAASTICVRRWFMPGAGVMRALAPTALPGAAMLAAALALGHGDAAAVAASLGVFAALAAPLAVLLPLRAARKAGAS